MYTPYINVYSIYQCIHVHRVEPLAKNNPVLLTVLIYFDANHNLDDFRCNVSNLCI